MGRLFGAVLVFAVLASAALRLPVRERNLPAQPVFFSMLFPQLVPLQGLEATAGEAVLL
ncbi:MAG: hypothetical protein ACI4MM_12400 [Candidatus Ventricola sp.]